MKIVCVFIFYFCFLLTVDAQSKKDVRSLSDSQIEHYIKLAESKGITEQQAINLAKSKGYSQTEIDYIRKRIKEKGNSKTESVISYKEVDDNLTVNKNENLLAKKVNTNHIFGSKFFSKQNNLFEIAENQHVSPDYIIKPGDEILIHIYGASQQNYQLFVSKDGYINIENLGVIYVANMNYSSMQKFLRKKLADIYRDLFADVPRTFATITIGNINGIKVNIIGEVNKPGSYNLNGNSRVFYALNKAEGINSNGSYRNIQIIRNNKVFATLDLYDFLIYQNTESNINLLNNDIIYIPSYLNHVKIEGAIRKPNVYELKNNESLNDLLVYAEGFTSNAKKDKIKIERNGEERKEIKTVDNFDCELLDGDIVYIGSILSEYNDRVTIQGAVFYPGAYEIADADLKSLIEKAGGLKKNAFVNRAYISRYNDQDLKELVTVNLYDVIYKDKLVNIQNKDVIQVKTINELKDNPYIEVNGYVRNQGTFEFEENMTLADAIFMAGGFQEIASSDFIEVVSRLSYEEAKNESDVLYKIQNFSINRDLKIDKKDQKLKLHPFDKIYIKKAPGYKNKEVATIRGEINYAGSYQIINKKEKISDLVKRAGFLTCDANEEAAVLIRNLGKNKLQQKMQHIIENDSSITIDTYISNRVPIDLVEILKNPGTELDLILQNGDIIEIPKKKQTVEVIGNVLNPTIIPFIERKGLKYYVDACGGTDELARKRKIYVLYANGKGSAVKNRFFYKNYPKIKPGCTVVVPEKQNINKVTLGDVGSTLTGVTGTLVGFIVLFRAL